uniref:Protein kinase domain-containing protein n=1 Tax=Populus trichocarpa TaxID=3694 RepID=A0A2K1XDL8_POPTR
MSQLASQLLKISTSLANGLAEVTSNGPSRLTNETKQQKGHAFYPSPVQPSRTLGHGIVFVIAPTRGLPGVLPSQWLGLFNESNNGNQTNHVVAVELYTIYSEFKDINDRHVGIDINGLRSVKSASAGYFSNPDVRVEYDGMKKQLGVTLAPTNVIKHSKPLLFLPLDLSPILNYLYISTRGFRDKELLGGGRFGRVYKGVLPTSKIEIAVKRGFLAEIVSIVHLLHRNLVPLLGYCRRKGELLLVYDYMPNGSSDKYLYDQPTHARNGKATTSTNVFFSGAFLLEVASGRRPIQQTEDVILLEVA